MVHVNGLDLELVEHATDLAAVAIQRDRAEAALRKNMRMRQIVFDGVVDVRARSQCAREQAKRARRETFPEWPRRRRILRAQCRNQLRGFIISRHGVRAC